MAFPALQVEESWSMGRNPNPNPNRPNVSWVRISPEALLGFGPFLINYNARFKRLQKSETRDQRLLSSSTKKLAPV
jgi:hypothetical protein